MLTHGKFILKIVEYRRFLPIETFLGFKHAGDEIVAVIVEAVANVVEVDALAVVLAVK